MRRRIRLGSRVHRALVSNSGGAQCDTNRRRVRKLLSNRALSIAGVMGAGTMTADGIIAGPGAELDAVGFPAPYATRQMSAVRGHVPETLAAITL